MWFFSFLLVCSVQYLIHAESCSFTGQCVYNVKVHHCNDTVTKRASAGNCDCSDLEIVQGETYNLQTSLSALESEFNALVKKYEDTMAAIKQKKQQLDETTSGNTAMASKLKAVDYQISQTTESVNRQTSNWQTEKARLETLTTESAKNLQTCLASLKSVNGHSGHGMIDSTSSTPISQSFCGFEDSSMCGYVQESGSHWSRQTSTYSSTTGPKQDHTYGNPHGHYMMLDSKNSATSSSSSTHTSRIDSPQYPTSTSGYCVKFWYNMHGKDITSLKVYAKVGSGLGYPVWTHDGEVDSDWHLAEISLDTEYTANRFRLVFETSTRAYYTSHYVSSHYQHSYYKENSNTAIDDVAVYNTSCKRLPASPQGAYVRQNGSDTAVYTFHKQPLSWYDAKRACRQENIKASLVSVNSRDEQEYLVRTIQASTDLSSVGSLGYYTSGSDDRVEHTFEWTETGNPYAVTYANWHMGQPNNVGGVQDCLLLQYSDADYEWGDVSCTEKHPYICEYHM